jgi:hypothetical protein
MYYEFMWSERNSFSTNASRVLIPATSFDFQFVSDILYFEREHARLF